MKEKEKNEYKTNNRARIMDFLMANSDRTVSVKDIDLHLKNDNNPVNLTTIYRYLDKLTGEGSLIKYTGETGDKTTYQLSRPGHSCDEHLHLKCTECGRVIHLDCHFMEEIAEHISNDHGFGIQCKGSVIYGICSECGRRHK